MVGIHHPRAIREPVSRDEVGRPEVHVARRRSVADRPDAQHRIKRLEPAHQVLLLGRLVLAAHALVHVAVVADLVPGIGNTAEHLVVTLKRRILTDDEKRDLEVSLVEKLKRLGPE